MPIKIFLDGKEKIVRPTTQPKAEKLEASSAIIKVDPNYYVYSFSVMGN